MSELWAEKLAKLRENYANNFPEKIKKILSTWDQIKEFFNQEAFKSFHRDIHSLSGTSGSYGYFDVCNNAKHLEIYLKELITHPTISDTQKNEIDFLLKKVSESSLKETLETVSEKNELTQDNIIIGICLEDNLNKTVKAEVESIKYRYVSISLFSEISAILEKTRPVFLIINTASTSLEELLFLKEYRQNHNVIYIYVGQENNLEERLHSVLGGGDLFFNEASEPMMLAELISRYSRIQNGQVFRVLVLDDVEELAQYYALLIQEGGMLAKAISEPMKLLEILDEFNPDLLLMDLYMPSCNGLELAEVLRQTERYFNLPIIFISSEENYTKQLATLTRGGANIFLTKPIFPAQLVATVKFLLRRAVIQNNLMKTDRLTGLLTHVYFLQLLHFEYIRAQRFHEPMCIAMLDIDFFKNVNDSYGHIVGDLVLKEIANILISRLRKIDHISRYGGDEFAIILPKTALNEAKNICEGLCKKIREIAIRYQKKVIKITISIGLAMYSQDHSEKTVLEMADQALYQAKKAGRDQVIVFQSRSHSE